MTPGTTNRTIDIIVAPDGSLSLQTRGFTGAACRDASRTLEQALGLRLSEQLTAEFHLRQMARDEHSERA